MKYKWSKRCSKQRKIINMLLAKKVGLKRRLTTVFCPHVSYQQASLAYLLNYSAFEETANAFFKQGS